MTDEELLIEARKRYAVASSIKSAISSGTITSHLKVGNICNEGPIWGRVIWNIMDNGFKGGWLYSDKTGWADIISYKEGYQKNINYEIY